MKVLNFFKTSLPQTKGGIEVFIDTLSNDTADLGVTNTVLSLAANPSKEPILFPKYKVIQAKQNLYIASTGISISAFTKFKRLAADADIIHYHFPNPFADILHFACGINKPTLLTYHSDIIKQNYLLRLYKPLMNEFLKSVDHIIATSPNYLATSSVLSEFKEKTTIIPIGINKENYPPLNKQRLQYWQKRLPQPFFLFIGAMRYYKGLHIALEAIKGTNIQLVLVGINGLEDELKACAKKKQMDNVHFFGLISDEDKVALLHLCYGFVFPSHLRAEAFGISLLEASAYGKPLISCEIGTGTSFINIHQETGLVIEPSLPNSLRQAMQYLLENPAKATEFGKNAEQRYQTHFTAEKQAQAYFQVYQKLLKASRSTNQAAWN